MRIPICYATFLSGVETCFFSVSFLSLVLFLLLCEMCRLWLFEKEKDVLMLLCNFERILRRGFVYLLLCSC